MTETTAHLDFLARWAKVIYGLTALDLLVTTALMIADLAPGDSVIDAGLILFFAITAHARRSRGCATVVAVLGAYYVTHGIMFIASGANFPKPFAYDDEVLRLVLALDVLVTLAAIKCAIAAFRYHRAAGTRIVWENVKMITFVALTLCVALFVIGLMVSLLLPENSLLVGWLAVGLFSLIAALAIWRKIPGMESLPVVVTAEEAPERISPRRLAAG